MRCLIKPKKLCVGDTVATISLSGGRAGDPDMLERYNIGKKRLINIFGLNVVEAPNSLKGNEYLYKNPKARADDLMWALENNSINGIVANMGGDDGVRLLPYINFDTIRDNPKILLGFSDISTFHNMFTYAGVSSFYGANLLATISQPNELDEYTQKWIKKILFSNYVIGEIEPCKKWTKIEWNNNNHIGWTENAGYEVLQGTGKVRGRLLGGCAGSLQQIMGTKLFPNAAQWKNSIIFLELLSTYGIELAVLHQIRAFAATGMFKNAKGLICANMNNTDKGLLLKVLKDEEGLTNLPILLNVDFGHKVPMTILPIGAMAEIDCDKKLFSILESGVE